MHSSLWNLVGIIFVLVCSYIKTTNLSLDVPFKVLYHCGLDFFFFRFSYVVSRIVISGVLLEAI